MPLHRSVDSPDTSDLQLGLGARFFGFHRLICNDGGGRAAWAHIIEHHILKENHQTFRSSLVTSISSHLSVEHVFLEYSQTNVNMT